MSAEPKLPRWTEPGSDAPEELSQLLRAGRAPLGTSEEVAQLAQGLGQILGPAAGLSAASLAAPAASAGLGLLRWSAWAAAVVSSAGALWYFTTDSAPPAAPAPPAPVEHSVPAPVLEPAPALQPAPAEPEPEPAAPPRASQPARPRAPAGSTEAELLGRAQSLLAAQPARALALTTEHQRRFRGGKLAEEREALAIEALRRLNRLPEAQRRAAAFLRRYPHSVHASRVRGTTAPAPAAR